MDGVAAQWDAGDRVGGLVGGMLLEDVFDGSDGGDGGDGGVGVGGGGVM